MRTGDGARTERRPWCLPAQMGFESKCVFRELHGARSRPRLLHLARRDCLAFRLVVDGRPAEPKQADEQLVLLFRELLHRAIAGLLEDPTGDRLLQLGCDPRITEGIEQGRQSGENSLEEMLDPADSPAN